MRVVKIADSESSEIRPVIISLSRAVGDLVHALQRERGGSSVFAASSGTRFVEELTALRAETDRQLQAFLTSCDDDVAQDLLASSEYTNALRRLGRLAAVRNEVDQLAISASDAIVYLTDLNEALLILSGTLIERVPNTQDRAQMLGLLALLRAKELTGIERAVLAEVFTEDKFCRGRNLWTVALISAQETLLRIAVGGNDETFAAELARLNTSEFGQNSTAMETAALVNGVGGFELDPADWFAQITGRIDLLKKLEDDLFDRLSNSGELTTQDDDHIVAEAISATVIAMSKLRTQVDQVRDGTLPFRRFMRGHGEALVTAETQLSTALQAGELTVRATRDELTGVLNRSTVPALIEGAMRRCTSSHEQVAALMVDLDNFKVINDSLGHTVGDELLRSFANRLRRSVRPDDVVTRVGGDEFLIIASAIGSTREVEELAEYVIAHCAEPHQIDGRELSVNVSIGIGLAHSGHEVDDLLRDADLALHRAKKNGRNGAVIFDDALRAEMQQRHEIEMGVRTAISEGTIRAHFQPIVDLETGEIIAAEALARWHRGDEVLTAGEFCPIAADAGLLPKIDEIVVRSAFANRPEHNGQSPKLSVNVSDLQLRQPFFAEHMHEQMVTYDIPPTDVWIEVTEHYALSYEEAVGNLTRLREMGCTIALDDFGSGFSALSVLRTLPLDVVKLDGLFVHGIDTDQATRETVRSVLDILNTLGLQAVAEGVETRSELEVLASLGCGMAQGFYVATPAADGASWKIPDMPGVGTIRLAS